MANLVVELVDQLTAAGASSEIIAIAVRALARQAEANEAVEAARRQATRERQRRHRLSRDGHATATLRDGSPAKRPRRPSKSAEPRRSGPHIQTPREILLERLTPEMAEAVVEHRKKLRAPLTAIAARSLVRAFGETGDPNAAATMMLARGWRGFEAHWYCGERPNGKRSLVEVGLDLYQRDRAERLEREARNGKRSVGDAADDLVRQVDEHYAERDVQLSNNSPADSVVIAGLLPAL